MTKGFLGDRTILDGMMKKQTQAINFYFFISFNAFWTFLRFRNSSWDFFGINFLSRDFSSGFGGSPRDFVWFLFLPPFDHPCHLKSHSPPPPTTTKDMYLSGHWAWVCWMMKYSYERQETLLWITSQSWNYKWVGIRIDTFSGIRGTIKNHFIY